MHLILTRAQYPEVREFSLEYTRIPDMYFQQQPESYQNNKIYVPLEMYNFNNTVSSKTVPSIIVSFSQKFHTQMSRFTNYFSVHRHHQKRLTSQLLRNARLKIVQRIRITMVRSQKQTAKNHQPKGLCEEITNKYLSVVVISNEKYKIS